MDASGFDSQIKAKVQEMESFRSALEKLRIEFVESACQFIPTWCNAKVMATLVNDPTATMEAGPQKMATLKAKVNAFLKGFPEIIQATLDEDKYWPHRQPLPARPRHMIRNYDYSHHESRQIIHDGIRELFGHVGKILIDQGFVNPRNAHGEWRARQTGPGKSGELIEYAYSFNWEEKMESNWKRYFQRYDQMLSANDDLKLLEIEKARAEVQNLWEKA